MNLILHIDKTTLSELHLKAGDNQKEIADKAGFDASYVSLVLRGKRKITKKNFAIIRETKKMIERMEKDFNMTINRSQETAALDMMAIMFVDTIFDMAAQRPKDEEVAESAYMDDDKEDKRK